jgi:hypothetical protein
MPSTAQEARATCFEYPSGEIHVAETAPAPLLAGQKVTL